MYTCALGTCMLAFVLVVGTIVALVVMPSWAWFVSVSNTCRKRADASHGRNESSVQIVVAHTNWRGKKFICALY